MKQRVLWRGLAVLSGVASAALVRQVALAVWRASRHDDPPTHPGAPGVSWHDALIWTVSVAVGAAVARVVAERAAAAAWSAATGSPPPVEN